MAAHEVQFDTPRNIRNLKVTFVKQLFHQKTGKILVVESSGPNRFMLSETLEMAGFRDVIGVETAGEALGVLQTDAISWIITELNADATHNGLQLVKLITENPALKRIFVSLVLSDEEKYVIPKAFELGALSWHPRNFTREALLAEWNALVSLAEQSDFTATLVAAHYLREHLKSEHRQQELLAFEKELIRTYPANTGLFLNMVYPLHCLGDKQEARSVLRLIPKIAPALTDQATEIDKELFHGQALDSSSDSDETAFNFLGLKKVVVVDSDETTHTQARNFMSILGCKDIQFFDNGLSAQQYIEKNPEPDLIIQEWRLRQLSGPAFLQRIKSSSAVTTPVIIASSLVKKEDLPFIHEMGVASLIPKPLEKETFIRTLTLTMQQDRTPKDQATLERKIRAHLAQGHLKEALALQQKFQENHRIPQHAKTLMEAEIAFANQQYDVARTMALETIKFMPDSLHALNLLGKILLKQGEYELSLKCFEKAQKLAPQNIERLCSMAELNAEVGKRDEAEAAIEKAMMLDDSSEAVQASRISVAITSHDHNRAKKHLTGFKGIERIIAAMNNAAVAMINRQRFDDGIAKYNATLQSIPNDRTDLQALVLYNLGLAYARSDLLQQSLEALDACLMIKESKVLKKAHSLKIKVILSLEKGLCLDSKNPPAKHSDDYAENRLEADAELAAAGRPTIAALAREIDASLLIQKGDIGCYMIYRAPQGDDTGTKLFKNPLPFPKKAPAPEA
jgi:CheY-like chemotaxis protein